MTEEKLDAFHTKRETSPRKSLKQLPQTMVVWKLSAQRTTKLLKLRPQKTLVVAAVMVNISKQPRNYFTSHVKGRIRDGEKLY